MKERKDMWVCVETSLSTHLAMPLSPYTTAADLKREVGKEHSICFPSRGMIKINGLMVKHRSHHYHLPDWIPVKDVFQGWKRSWFLHVDATPYPCDKPPPCQSNVYSGSNVADAPVPEYKCNTDNKARERKGEECAWSQGIPDVRISEKNKRKKKKKKKRCRNKLVDGMEMEGQGNVAAEVFKFNTDDKAKKTQIDVKIPERDKERSCSNKGVDGMEGQGIIMAAEVGDKTHSSGMEMFVHGDGDESPSVSVSEASLSGLIMRYFPADPPPPRRLLSKSSHKTRLGVGKRILLAANSFENSASKKSHRSNIGQSSLLVVFDVNDSA